MRPKPIVVAGSINMDLVIDLERAPRPGETVLGNRIRHIPGGKGLNQAIAARRLADGPVALIGKMGRDPFGDSLIHFLQSQDLGLTGLTSGPTPTGTAIVTIDSSAENSIVVVPGANFELGPGDIDSCREAISMAGVVVAQLEIPVLTVERLFQIAMREGITTILNAAPAREVSPEVLGKVDYLCVNETELAVMARGGEVSDELDSVVAGARALRSKGPKNIVVTLGSKGSVTLAGDEVIVVPGLKVDARDPTGAGDCFVGGLAARLNAGSGLRKALDFANKAAALSVQRIGASSSIPYSAEVEA